MKREKEHYYVVGWQRVSLSTGSPVGHPKMHLTVDDQKTCCGIRIPKIGTRTRHHQIEELDSHRECGRCFTPERRNELSE